MFWEGYLLPEVKFSGTVWNKLKISVSDRNSGTEQIVFQSEWADSEFEKKNDVKWMLIRGVKSKAYTTCKMKPPQFSLDFVYSFNHFYGVSSLSWNPVLRGKFL